MIRILLIAAVAIFLVLWVRAAMDVFPPPRPDDVRQGCVGDHHARRPVHRVARLHDAAAVRRADRPALARAHRRAHPPSPSSGAPVTSTRSSRSGMPPAAAMRSRRTARGARAARRARRHRLRDRAAADNAAAADPLQPVDIERERRDFATASPNGWRASKRSRCWTFAGVAAGRGRLRRDGLRCRDRRGAPRPAACDGDRIAARSFSPPELVAEPLDATPGRARPPDPGLETMARHLVLVPFPPLYRDPVSPLAATARAFRPSPPRFADARILPRLLLARDRVQRRVRRPLWPSALRAATCPCTWSRRSAATSTSSAPASARAGRAVHPAGRAPAAREPRRLARRLGERPRRARPRRAARAAADRRRPAVQRGPLRGARCRPVARRDRRDTGRRSRRRRGGARRTVLPRRGRRMRDEFAALPGPEHAIALIERLA